MTFIEIQNIAGNDLIINTDQVQYVRIVGAEGDSTDFQVRIGFAGGTFVELLVNDDGYAQVRQLVDVEV